MKVETADLIGPALDWAVAKCEAIEVEYINDGITRCLLRVSLFTGLYSPSNDWSQGGPIIERERISVAHDDDGEWEACQRAQLQSMFGFNGDNYSTGPTPLIAAMRCFVASRLGDEVDVPDELV